MWVKIALRNVLRNPRRTALSLVIISLGTGMLFAVSGFVNFINEGLTEGTIEQYGNLQIAHPGYWDRTEERDASLIHPGQLERLSELLGQFPEVVGYSGQLEFSGQVQRGSESQVLFGAAVDPGRRIISGYEIDEGEDLQGGDQGKIVIGRLLADDLGVGIGDYLTMLIATVDGAFNTGRLQVSGIFRAFEEVIETQVAYTPLETGQALLNTDGVDKVVVELSSLQQTERVAAALHAALEEADLDLEPRTWDELGTEYRQTRNMFDFILGAVSLGIFVLVLFSILEVLTMSFMERTREVGTIRAIGTQRGQVFRLFLTEGLLLGLIGGLLGILVGLGLGELINASGIGWEPPGAIEPVPILVKLTSSSAVVPLFIALASTAISTIFPALRSSRLRVVEALRTT